MERTTQTYSVTRQPEVFNHPSDRGDICTIRIKCIQLTSGGFSLVFFLFQLVTSAPPPLKPVISGQGTLMLTFSDFASHVGSCQDAGNRSFV